MEGDYILSGRRGGCMQRMGKRSDIWHLVSGPLAKRDARMLIELIGLTDRASLTFFGCVIIGLLPFPVSTHTDLQLSFPPRSLPAPLSLSLSTANLRTSLPSLLPRKHLSSPATHGQTIASELLPAMSWLFLGVINALSYILEAQPAPIDPPLHGQKTRCTSNTPQLPIKGNSPPHLPSITPKLILPRYIRKTRHYNGLGDGPNASKG